MKKKLINLEYHPHDSRIKIKPDEICQTLSGRMGTGGGNVPLIMMMNERICTCCGKQMDSGYCIGDGEEYFCSDECLNAYYSEEEYEQMCQEDYAYWTEWFDE